MTFKNLTELLLARADRSPDRKAFVFLGDGITLPCILTDAGLAERAAGVAALLRAQGVRHRRNVLVALPTGPDFAASFFGCMLAGTIPVPCTPPGNPRHDIRFPALLAGSGADAVLAESAAIRRFFSIRKAPLPQQEILKAGGSRHAPHTTRWIGIDEAPTLPCGNHFLSHPPSSNDIAFIQFSSGSTAAPRGVVIRQDNVVANVKSCLRVFRVGIRSVFVSWLPVHHDMGLVGMLLVPFARGNTVVFLPPASFARDPLLWLETISEYGDVISGGPNFAYDLCATRAMSVPDRVGNLTLEGWATAFVGAESVSRATLNRFADVFSPSGFDPAAFRPCYGLAESTLMVSCAADLRCEPTSGIASCGPAAPGTRIAITNLQTSDALPDGKEGEIRVSGSSVAEGYYRQRAATRETFHSTIPGRRGDWLRTGDLGFLRNGELFVTGRIKDVLIIRGRKLHPIDLERTALETLSSRDRGSAAAFSCRTATGEEGVTMAVELPRNLLRNVAVRVEAIRVIRAAVCRVHGILLDDVITVPPGFLPRTTSGKIRRFQCRERLSIVDPYVVTDSETTEATNRFYTPTERFVRDILFRLTGTTPVSPDDKLYDLGLDSLSLLALVSELGDYGFLFAVDEMDDFSTVAELVAKMDMHLNRILPTEYGLQSPDQTVREPEDTGPWVTKNRAPEVFPLTLSQVRFLPPYAKENGTLIFASFFLPPNASFQNVESAIHRMIGRHDALRLRVQAGVGGEFSQWIAPIEEHTLLQQAEIPVGLSRSITSFQDHFLELARFVDPGKGPVMCGKYFGNTAERASILLLCIHHLCVDMASCAYLFREFAETLFRFSSGRSIPETPPMPGFGNYLLHICQSGMVNSDASSGCNGRNRHLKAFSLDDGVSARVDHISLFLAKDRTHFLYKKIFSSRRWRPDLALAWSLAWAVAGETGNHRICVWMYRHNRDRTEVPLQFRKTVGMLADYQHLWPDIRSARALDRFLDGHLDFLNDDPYPEGRAWDDQWGAGQESAVLPVLFNYLGDTRVTFPDFCDVRLKKFMVRGEGSPLGWSSRWSAGARVDEGQLNLRLSTPGGAEASSGVARAVMARMQNVLDALIFLSW